jgi:hypothetical protein
VSESSLSSPFYPSRLLSFNDLGVRDASRYVCLFDNSRTRRRCRCRRFQPGLRRTHRYRETTTCKHRILDEGRVEARIRLSHRSSPRNINIRRRVPRRWVQSVAYRFRGQYSVTYPSHLRVRVAPCQSSLLSKSFFLFRRCATLSQRWFSLSFATYPRLHIDDHKTMTSESESLRLLDMPKRIDGVARCTRLISVHMFPFIFDTDNHHHSIYNRFGYVNSWGVSARPPAFGIILADIWATDFSSVLPTNPPTRLTTIKHVRKTLLISSNFHLLKLCKVRG